jgi:hypothetical protein
MGDGADPGTVFVTAAHGVTTIWTVIERTADTLRYARTTPGHLAGTVTIRLSETADGVTSAEVTYDLTALTAAAEPELADFVQHYDAFMAGWESAIGSAIAADGS